MNVERKPIVSIGMPVCNGSRYIREALDSLLTQTYSNFELIISDNASTDNTKQICEEYVKKDGRIKYIRQCENIGAFRNFKFVLDESVGEYFMWSAHDDLRDSNYIEVLLKGFTEKDVVLAYSDTYVKTLSVIKEKKFFFDNTNSSTFKRLYRTASSQFYHIYGLWKVSYLKKIHFRHTYIWPDMPIMMSASYLGFFKYVNGTKFIYYEEKKTNKKRILYQDGKTEIPKFLILKMVFATFLSLKITSRSMHIALIGSSFVFVKHVSAFVYSVGIMPIINTFRHKNCSKS